MLPVLAAALCFARPARSAVVDLPAEQVTGSLIYAAEEV
jgi:hypothetical protein